MWSLVSLGRATAFSSLQGGSTSVHSAGESVVKASLSPTPEPGTNYVLVWRLQSFGSYLPQKFGEGSPEKGRLNLSSRPGHATSVRVLPPADRWMQKFMGWGLGHPGRSIHGEYPPNRGSAALNSKHKTSWQLGRESGEERKLWYFSTFNGTFVPPFFTGSPMNDIASSGCMDSFVAVQIISAFLGSLYLPKKAAETFFKGSVPGPGRAVTEHWWLGVWDLSWKSKRIRLVPKVIFL